MLVLFVIFEGLCQLIGVQIVLHKLPLATSVDSSDSIHFDVLRHVLDQDAEVVVPTRRPYIYINIWLLYLFVTKIYNGKSVNARVTCLFSNIYCRLLY